jgi:hypothetical protein
MVHRADLARACVEPAFAEMVPERNPMEIRSVLQFANYQLSELAANKGTCTANSVKALLDSYGLNERAVSMDFSSKVLLINVLACPLWLLESLHDNLFRHLGMCWLHIEDEGNLKHVISTTVSSFSDDKLCGMYAILSLHAADR